MKQQRTHSKLIECVRYLCRNYKLTYATSLVLFLNHSLAFSNSQMELLKDFLLFAIVVVP